MAAMTSFENTQDNVDCAKLNRGLGYNVVSIFRVILAIIIIIIDNDKCYFLFFFFSFSLSVIGNAIYSWKCQ